MKTIEQVGTIFFTDKIKSVGTETVKRALDESELDPELAKDLAKRYCFGRAKNRLNTEGILDEVNDTDTRWTFQLSDRYRQDKKLSYEYKAQIWFDKQTETVGCDNPGLLAQVTDLFAQYGAMYLPSDVNKLVHRIFDRQYGMVSLRHHGAVYFVPSENSALMNRVFKFITAIGGDCLIVPIQQGNKPIVEQAKTSLVENVKKDMAKIVEEMNVLRQSGTTLTTRKANNRWKQLLQQIERIKMFARSLQVDSSDLINKVRSTELDLALVSGDNLDVIAALAQAGKITGTMSDIARNAFTDELPALNSPRVKEFLDNMPDVSTVELPVLKNVAKTTEVLADV